jgi:hypothetical protein
MTYPPESHTLPNLYYTPCSPTLQGDDLLLNKQVAALKDVSAQLPPVMSAIEARWEGRALGTRGQGVDNALFGDG